MKKKTIHEAFAESRARELEKEFYIKQEYKKEYIKECILAIIIGIFIIYVTVMLIANCKVGNNAYDRCMNGGDSQTYCQAHYVR